MILTGFLIIFLSFIDDLSYIAFDSLVKEIIKALKKDGKNNRVEKIKYKSLQHIKNRNHIFFTIALSMT